MGPREPDLPGQIKSFLESWSISVCSNEAQIGKTKVHTYILLHKTFLHRTVSCTYVPCHSCPYPSLHIILCYVHTYIRMSSPPTLFNQDLPSSVLPSYSSPCPSLHIILCYKDICTYIRMYIRMSSPSPCSIIHHQSSVFSPNLPSTNNIMTHKCVNRR